MQLNNDVIRCVYNVKYIMLYIYILPVYNNDLQQLYNNNIYIYIPVYIYIGSRLGVPRSFEEPSVLIQYQKGRSCNRWGGWGGVITSCEVRWMMLNPGRCCLVGRCCYICCIQKGGGGGGGVYICIYRLKAGGCQLASFVVFTEGGLGGWGGVITM